MREIALGLAIMYGVGLNAQQSVIDITSELTMLCDCDTVSVGDTVKYQYTITNTGDAAMAVAKPYWNGGGWTFVPTYDNKIQVTNENTPLSPIEYSFVDDDIVKVSMKIIDPVDQEELDYVEPNKSAIVQIEDVVVPSRHKEGNNTIVVWPDNIYGTTILDTLEYEMKVLGTTSSPDLNSKVEPWLVNSVIYPNPSSNVINIQGISENKTQIRSISIRDLNGKIVKQFDCISEQYNISEISSGHYTISFELEGNAFYAKPLLVK